MRTIVKKDVSIRKWVTHVPTKYHIEFSPKRSDALISGSRSIWNTYKKKEGTRLIPGPFFNNKFEMS